MKNRPSLSASGPQTKPDYPENKNWWLFAPKLALHQLAFGLRYLWHQTAPAALLLKPARITHKVQHLTTVKKKPPTLNPFNLLIPAFALTSLAFLVYQIVILSKSPEVIAFYLPATELVTAASEAPLPSPLTLTSQDQREVPLQDLTQTLSRNLELLRQQPLHQNLLINTALIYYQLHDEENYLRYLDLAKNINPNLEVFPTTVEN